mgnify:CR=1 FL=1
MKNDIETKDRSALSKKVDRELINSHIGETNSSLTIPEFLERVENDADYPNLKKLNEKYPGSEVVYIGIQPIIKIKIK